MKLETKYHLFMIGVVVFLGTMITLFSIGFVELIKGLK